MRWILILALCSLCRAYTCLLDGAHVECPAVYERCCDEGDTACETQEPQYSPRCDFEGCVTSTCEQGYCFDYSESGNTSTPCRAYVTSPAASTIEITSSARATTAPQATTTHQDTTTSTTHQVTTQQVTTTTQQVTTTPATQQVTTTPATQQVTTTPATQQVTTTPATQQVTTTTQQVTTQRVTTTTQQVATTTSRATPRATTTPRATSRASPQACPPHFFRQSGACVPCSNCTRRAKLCTEDQDTQCTDDDKPNTIFYIAVTAAVLVALWLWYRVTRFRPHRQSLQYKIP